MNFIAICLGVGFGNIFIGRLQYGNWMAGMVLGILSAFICLLLCLALKAIGVI